MNIIVKKRIFSCIQTAATLACVTLFAALDLFAQAPPAVRESDTELLLRIMGWIFISGASLAHIASNIYSVVKGKDYEQIKEAAANYKELADSRKAQLAEARSEIKELEIENENLKERILRGDK